MNSTTEIKSKRITEGIFAILIMIILSVLIMVVTFAFSSAMLNVPLFKSYFQGPMLMLMNFIPIFLFMAFTYLISNRLWVGFSLTSLLFVTMGIVNKFKLTYRDDPFTFMDIKLVGESLVMAKTYDISLSTRVIIMLIGFMGIAVILKLFVKFKINSKKVRISSLLLLSIISIFIFNSFYFNSKIYEEVGDASLINRWVGSQRFQSKGFVYPFIYSIQDAKEQKLEGYDEKKAKEDLYKNSYKDIPSDKKVNVIGIMLEAYNDFSEFEDVDLGIDIYKNLHQIQKEAIHGKLVTNVFAGDTINTERGFITGYNSHPKYFNHTNSFAWYLKEQGYRTEAMHPITGSFYNRRNVNEYLGFDKYDHYDNKYKALQEEYLMDIDFFDYIIEGFENSKKDNQPYLNFSVTYQNHGPYADVKYSDKQYLEKKEHYDDGIYNIINNYMAGINKTDEALKKLFDHFRNEEEPTVIVIFGDHNPWLGKDNSGYNMLDIDLDVSSVEGFKNYYQTPYVIWGNDGAKETFDKDFTGEGNSISPNLLMSELFDYVGWEGNEYMQYISNMKAKFDVNHKLYFKENGEFTEELSEENKKLWERFRNVEYYNSHNFKKIAY